jgi:Eukaryotic aspartyl protease
MNHTQFEHEDDLLEGDDAMVEQTVNDYYDVQLFSKVHVGSSKQEFDVIFDTGSAVSYKSCKNACSGSGSKTKTALSVQLSIGMTRPTLQHGKSHLIIQSTSHMELVL